MKVMLRRTETTETRFESLEAVKKWATGCGGRIIKGDENCVTVQVPGHMFEGIDEVLPPVVADYYLEDE